MEEAADPTQGTFPSLARLKQLLQDRAGIAARKPGVEASLLPESSATARPANNGDAASIATFATSDTFLRAIRAEDAGGYLNVGDDDRHYPRRAGGLSPRDTAAARPAATQARRRPLTSATPPPPPPIPDLDDWPLSDSEDVGDVGLGVTPPPQVRRPAVGKRRTRRRAGKPRPAGPRAGRPRRRRRRPTPHAVPPAVPAVSRRGRKPARRRGGKGRKPAVPPAQSANMKQVPRRMDKAGVRGKYNRKVGDAARRQAARQRHMSATEAAAHRRRQQQKQRQQRQQMPQWNARRPQWCVSTRVDREWSASPPPPPKHRPPGSPARRGSPHGRARRRRSATGLSLLDGMGGSDGSDGDEADADAWSEGNVEDDVAVAGRPHSDDAEAWGDDAGDATASVHEDMFAVNLELEAEVRDLRRQVQRQAGLLKEKRAVVRKAVQSSSQLRAKLATANARIEMLQRSAEAAKESFRVVQLRATGYRKECRRLTVALAAANAKLRRRPPRPASARGRSSTRRKPRTRRGSQRRKSQRRRSRSSRSARSSSSSSSSKGRGNTTQKRSTSRGGRRSASVGAASASGDHEPAWIEAGRNGARAASAFVAPVEPLPPQGVRVTADMFATADGSDEEGAAAASTHVARGPLDSGSDGEFDATTSAADGDADGVADPDGNADSDSSSDESLFDAKQAVRLSLAAARRGR